MTLQFYNTGFDVTKNGVYENLETYIADGWFGNPVLETEYKHLDPALNQQIKLPISSHQFTKKYVGDYCRAEDEDGTVYYYYVMNCQWKGKETLLVTLSLDTLTTFWKDIESSWTDETHITRRYKDRYWLFNSTNAYPQIDKKDEDFGTVPMVVKSKVTVHPTTSFKNWTLVYMTKYTDDDALKENPVSCFCFPGAKTKINTTMIGDVTHDVVSLSDTHRYYMNSGMNAGDSFTIIQYPSGSSLTYTLGTNCAGVLFYPSQYTSGSGEVTLCLQFRIFNSLTTLAYTDYYASKVTFTKCKQVYLQSTSFTGLPAAADFTQPFAINAGESVSYLPAFNDWYEANKTDARLVKIREIPYSPFKEVYNSGVMEIPSGWKLTGTWLEFTGTTFGSYNLATTTGRKTLGLVTANVFDQPHDSKFETKFYNSAFYGDKLVYDNNTWVAKWENFNNTGKLNSVWLELSLNYAVSDGIDNGLLFKVNDSFDYDTDFGEYLICDKNTDLPYYTNDYLNYIKYGKYYDEKAAGLNVASSIVSGVGSAASTVASFAFSGATIGSAGGPITATGGAVLGTIVGLATTTMSVAKTCATAYDTINSKIDAYTHQASSVNGTSDLSLFKLYSGNKLVNILYEPRDDIKEMLYNYFRLYGYADDEYAIPTCTRRWVDYFKCEPVFSGDMLWNDFLDDIKTRMQLGFRIYHYAKDKTGANVAYDLKQANENWETSLWDWAHE